MERVTVDELDPVRFGDGVARRGLSDPLGTTDVSVNHYRLAPGEGLPAGLHAHADQEEVFVVLAGEVTFDTLVRRGGEREAGEVVVGAGETVRFAPGEFQSGRNDAGEEAVVFSLGAPRDTEDVRVPLACPGCGNDELRLAFGGDEFTFACPDCAAEHVPEGCPDCGHELEAALGEGDRVVAACPGCGAEFAEPPLADG